MQTEKSQPSGQRIMPETRFIADREISFPALSVDPGIEISRSASETDVWLFFLSMALKILNRFRHFFYL